LISGVPSVERLEVEQIWSKPGSMWDAFGTASLVSSDGSATPLLFGSRAKNDADDSVYLFRTPHGYYRTATGEVTRAHVRIRLSRDNQVVRRFWLRVSLRGRRCQIVTDPGRVTVAHKAPLGDWIQTIDGNRPGRTTSIDALVPFHDGSVLLCGRLSDRVHFGRPDGSWHEFPGEWAGVYVARISAGGAFRWVRTVERRVRDNDDGLIILTFPDDSCMVIKTEWWGGAVETDEGTYLSLEPPAGCERMSLVLRYTSGGSLLWHCTLAEPLLSPRVTAAIALDDGSAMLFGDAREDHPLLFSGPVGAPVTQILGEAGGRTFEIRLDAEGQVRSARRIGRCTVVEAVPFPDGSYVLSCILGKSSYLDPRGDSPAYLPWRGGVDAFLASFDSAGILRWVTAMGGASNDFLEGLVAYGEGRVAVAMESLAPGAIEIGTPEAGGRASEFTDSMQTLIVSFEPDGAIGWMSMVEGSGAFGSRYVRIAGDPGESLLLCGRVHQSTVSLNPGGPDHLDLPSDPAETLQVFLAAYADTGAFLGAEIIATTHLKHPWPPGGPIVAPNGQGSATIALGSDGDWTLWPATDRVTRLFGDAASPRRIFTTPHPRTQR
jgi:hypothetical protein